MKPEGISYSGVFAKAWKGAYFYYSELLDTSLVHLNKVSVDIFCLNKITKR